MMISSNKRYNWKGKKALVVEDDPAGSLLLAEILARTDIGVIQVDNGTKAVRTCREDPDIDIVLLDMQVPEKSGYDVALEIRAMRPDLPIIAQSAFISSEEKNRALCAGCNAHVSKPLNAHELLGIMHRLLYDTDELPIQG